MQLQSGYQKMRKRNIFLFATALLLMSCEKPETPVSLFEEQMFVMGTIVNVTIANETPQKSEKAFHDLLTDFKFMQAAWNPWKRGSLGRVNQLLPMQAEFTIGPAMKNLITQSRQLEAQSNGLFTPAIGKLVKLWQFNLDEMPTGPPPEDREIQKIVAANARMTDLDLNGLILKSRNPDLILDFGGFAKGYGLNKAVDHLKDIGVENAIVNAGGDLRAIGTKGGKPWVIGIRNPRDENIIASLEVSCDESVFTSGDYERFYDYKGKRYHHILDPRTGYPADKTTSVTVVHSDAAIADAAATALFVAGPELWETIAQKMGITQVMLIDKNGAIEITPELYQRIKFIQKEKLNISISTRFEKK